MGWSAKEWDISKIFENQSMEGWPLYQVLLLVCTTFCLWAAQSITESFLEHMIYTTKSLLYVANNYCSKIRSLRENWQPEIHQNDRKSVSAFFSVKNNIISSWYFILRANAAFSTGHSIKTCTCCTLGSRNMSFFWCESLFNKTKLSTKRLDPWVTFVRRQEESTSPSTFL